MNAVIEERDAALSQVPACIYKKLSTIFPSFFTLKNDFPPLILNSN